jgi:hypothetical protein
MDVMPRSKKHVIKLKCGDSAFIELLGTKCNDDESNQPIMVEVEWSPSGKLYIQSNFGAVKRRSAVILMEIIESEKLEQVNLTQPKRRINAKRK